MTTPEIPEARVMATKYDVTCLPDGDINQSSFTLTVEYRGAGRWAVLRFGTCLNRLTGKWSHESIPSERQDEWLDAHRFTVLDEALTVAKAMASVMRVNGHSVLDALGVSA